MSPLDALPIHLQDIENNFKDDEQFGTSTWFGRAYRWVNKKTKTWFCFSYRCRSKWARWRMYPKRVFAIGGEGYWRYENIDGRGEASATFFMEDAPGWYLSRQQKWKTWSFVIQWPLSFMFHVKWNGKLLFGYWNHFDADLVHWMVTSLYLGTRFK